MAYIKRVMKYEYNGKLFDTKDKAIEYAETLAYDEFNKIIKHADITIRYKDIGKLFQEILNNRQLFIEKLSFEFDDYNSESD